MSLLSRIWDFETISAPSVTSAALPYSRLANTKKGNYILRRVKWIFSLEYLYFGPKSLKKLSAQTSHSSE